MPQKGGNPSLTPGDIKQLLCYLLRESFGGR
jgi:hypothetical protein